MPPSSQDELFENLRLELRRGCLILAVLAELRAEQYGYTLRKALQEHGMEIDESTLYPLLRRLETQGLLLSQWREEDKRNKRFYRLSSAGEAMFARLTEEWHCMNGAFDRILQATDTVGQNIETVTDTTESGVKRADSVTETAQS